MSKDIRSYFVVGAKPGANNKNKPPATPLKKRKAIQISSDEDENPIEKPKRKSTKSKKARVIDSDGEDAEGGTSLRKPNLGNLKSNGLAEDKPKKVVDLGSLLGKEPKRIERKKFTNADQSELLLQSDEELEQTIIGLDESILGATARQSTNNGVTALRKSPRKRKSAEATASVRKILNNEDVQVKNSSEKATKTATPKKVKKSPSKIARSPAKKSHDATEKHSDLETSILADEDRQEKKRIQQILYQKYKNRHSVLNPGSKEIPKGKPNCLSGLSFLVTGVLESLEREEAHDLITGLGGKVSKTVGKRLSFMVVGEESGPKKIATAEQLGIKMISEDELFQLIKDKSGGKKDDRGKKEFQGVVEEKKEKRTPKKSPTKNSQQKIQQTPQKRKESPGEKGSGKKKKIKLTATEESTTRESVPECEEVKPKRRDASDARMLAWVDKYKPANTKQIIGQQGAASPCVKLTNWLSKWYSNHDGKKKLQKPNPWAKNDDGSYYKAALLSGPPGIGKTTTATLVCQELGFDIVEFNASDTRSKKLLKDEVSELLSNKSIFGYFHGNSKGPSKKHVLIMDEVDGMAGNEDRGGMQELIALIKDSSVPVICMCNDRNHQKIRSLANYCYDLRFTRPRLMPIKSAVMSICFKEGIKIPAPKVEEVIAATNNDVRQTLNHLYMLSAGGEIDLEQKRENTAKKDLKLGPWEVVRKVFSADEHKNMTLNEKSDLFFHDYSLGPLFVQQNYLKVVPHVPKNEVINRFALAADSLSCGDLVDKRIRSQSAWALLPTQAMFSSVLPGEYLSGHFTGQIDFPAWLGKNSKSGKRSRLAQEIHDHTRVRTSGSRLSIRLDYATFLLDTIVRPLKNGLEGVHESLAVIKEYRLLREDIDSLIELTSWPGKKNPMDAVDSKVKAALTRAYNKEVLAYSYSAAAGIKRKNVDLDQDLEGFNGDEEVAALSGDDDDKLENDALIKAKKKAKPSTSTASTSNINASRKASSTSKGKAKR